MSGERGSQRGFSQRGDAAQSRAPRRFRGAAAGAGPAAGALASAGAGAAEGRLIIAP